LTIAIWNEKDPFLKTRLFGVSGKQGNHGEDVKKVYQKSGLKAPTLRDGDEKRPAKAA
jgi:hypothetical protein